MWKRFVSFTLLGAMILSLSTGCNTESPGVETTPPTEVTTEPTQATAPTTTSPPPTTLPPETTAPKATQPVIVHFGSPVAGTSGALRFLPLDTKVYHEAYPFGENILLCTPQEGRYQVRSSKDGSVLASITDTNRANTVTVTEDQIIYYSLSDRQITFLDMDLQVLKRVGVSVNDDVSDMKFSQDGTKAYYRIDYHTIGELDIETGEERVIPVHGPQIFSLSRFRFEGSVLSYWGKENGDDYCAFINVETGAFLGMDSNITRFKPWGNGYYLGRATMGYAEHLVVQDGTYKYMTPENHGMRIYEATVIPLLNSFFTVSADDDKAVIILDLYDLTTKRRTSSLTIAAKCNSVSTVSADASGEYIWLRLTTGVFPNTQTALYRWDYRANAIEDTAVYGYGG